MQKKWRALLTIHDDGKPRPLSKMEIRNLILQLGRTESGIKVKIVDLDEGVQASGTANG